MSRNKHLFLTWKVVGMILLVTLMVGCQTGGQPVETQVQTATSIPKEEPTAAPTDTSLPPPTDTPAPTATATATATSTPDLEATAGAEATQAYATVMEKIKPELERVGVSPDEGSLGWLMTEPETITVNTYNTLVYSELDPDLTAADFVIHTDITWDSTGGWAICGIILRADSDLDKGAKYRFQTIRLTGWPSWDVERYEYGEWQATASNLVVNSRSIDQTNGATNQYTVVFRGTKFTIFVNDEKPKTVIDSKLKEGKFAFMNWQDTGETTCTFSDAWVWIIK